MKPDCSRHTKQVAGIKDMALLATAICELHYETLAELLEKMADKLRTDASADRKGGRGQLAMNLEAAANNIDFASTQIDSAWHICKPFMNEDKKES